MNLAWNIMTTFNGWQLGRLLSMGIHAGLIWSSVTVLALLGHGWHAWQSHDCLTGPSRFAVIGAAIPVLAESRFEGPAGPFAEQDSRSTTVPSDKPRRPEPAGPSSTAKVQTGRQYFISPKAGSGSGTLASPFGLADLLNPDRSQGKALTALQPGDTLFFQAGDYHLTGGTGNDAWSIQLLSPVVSGNASQPITLAAYPGATVRIFEDGGGQPVFGTFNPTLNHVRFIGFAVDAKGAAAFSIHGTGNEVAYCEVAGQYAKTTDNHDGIRIENANCAWIHHNNIHGITGDSHNSAGIKVYSSSQLLIEDNYIHDCTSGVFDKDAGRHGDGTNQATYRRNYITRNKGDQFLGNNQGSQALYYIYDNVVDGSINLYCQNTGSEVYNNLFRSRTPSKGGFGGVASWQTSYEQNIWNNIVLANKQAVWGYSVGEVSFSTRSATSPLRYMDYNVYDRTPAYFFNQITYTLPQLRARGFERHAAIVAGSASLFRDLTSYELKPRWSKAGRYGDPVGPRFPVARILDTRRYGPSALKTGNSPIITQQPQDQVASRGSIATFGVQATGSELSFQWERSKDGGATWVMSQGANSPVLKIPRAPASDDGAIFRCLVSCVGGSVWSDTAKLTVNSSSSTILMRP